MKKQIIKIRINFWDNMFSQIKKIFLDLRILLKPLSEYIIEKECKISVRLARDTHRKLMLVQRGLPPQPEFFDHHIDLFYQWQDSKNSFWVERGVFGSLTLKGGRVLDLSCGDGFNARNFYSLHSLHVIACDFDKKAIETAKKKNNAQNVEFIQADIRTDMPEGKYENITWDGAIEHFTLEEISDILKNIKTRLEKNGILSGYTIVEKNDGKSLSQHEYEFKSKEDLMNTLKPYFNNITVFETINLTRHNLYFWASDGVIPFHKDWEKMICYTKIDISRKALEDETS